METLWLFCVVTAVCFQFVPIIGDSSHNVKTVTKDATKLDCVACERLSTQSPHNQEKGLINKKQPLRPAQKTASASRTDRAPDSSPSNSNRDSLGERQTQSPHNQEKDLVKKKQRLRPPQKTASASSRPAVHASAASPSNSNSDSTGKRKRQTQSSHNQQKDLVKKKQRLRPHQKTASDRASAASPSNSNSDSSGKRRTQSPHNQEKDLVKKKQRLRPPQKTATAGNGPAVHASAASPSNSNSDSSGEHHSQHYGQQGAQNTMVPTCPGPALGAGCEGTTQGAGASSNPPSPQNYSDVFVPILHENTSSDNSPCISDEDEKQIDETNGPPLDLCFDLENSKSTTVCEHRSSVSSSDIDKEDVKDIM